ncbi:MAG: NAD(P)-dependent oxidoreductase [Bacteroidetes bacterium]|nr:NAD(P)-dependent oxidoreductase [Bacteroidota bacterium]
MQVKNISVVTGGNGFVGSHLVDLLLEKGHHVKCIVRKSSNLQWLKNKNVEIINCGLNGGPELNDVLKDADYLFHVAGVVKAKKPEGYYKGNVEPTKVLLDTLLEVNKSIKRVLIVSSLTACGPAKLNMPCTEETIPHPLTNYGKSKLAQEELSKEYMEKLPITIVRPPAVYGERDTEIYLYFKTYKAGLMTLIGFNDKQVSLIHVIDLVEGIYLAAINENSKGETYFISSEKFYTWPELSGYTEKAVGKKAFKIRIPHFLVLIIGAVAQFFAMFSSKPATFNFEKAKDFIQEAQTCDTSKAVNQLAYRQKISIEEGMKRTVNWYREMKWL